MKLTNKQNMLLGVAALMVLGGIAWISLRMLGESTGESSAVASGIETLSPEIFTGRTREAYQAAKDVPEVLEQLPCYCGCRHIFNHENNLFCFKDEHASACTICEDIALEGRKMHDEGLPIDRIKEVIKDKYSQYEP